MSAIEQVRGARAALLATLAGAALVWTTLAAAAVILLYVIADLALALPLGLRRLAIPLALVAGVLALAAVLWRGRHARTLARVALYIEERVPALQYSLVTAVDAGSVPGAPGTHELELAVAHVSTRGALCAPLSRAIAIPVVGLALGLAALALLPRGTLERVLHPRAGDVLLRPAPREPLANRLASIAVRVTPPRYANLETRTSEDPSSVAALVGSRIEVRGRGAAAGLTDSLGALLDEGKGSSSGLEVAIVGDTWGVSVAMPKKPAAVRLADRAFDRLLVLEPIVDAPPTVTLITPARDTVYSEGKGKLVLRAQLEDDIGLDHAHFELLHTSGGGEGFETKRSVVGSASFRNGRSATISASILLDTMQLGPGDVLNMRALAWDANDVTGPGQGESETRTIRIYDSRQRDTVNINPAAAAALDTSIISQRMLIIRADSLRAHKPKLAAEDYVAQSLDLGLRQEDLRNKVQGIVYDLEHVRGVGFVGETPSSKILKKAGDAMLDASTELRIASVSTALPHMWRALRFLQDARNAKRYWLRGVLLNKPVEIEKVRLTGTDKASVSERDPRDMADSPRRELLRRVDRAIVLSDELPAAGSDSLKMILVDALTAATDVVDPLREAIDAMQKDTDSRAALVEVRRRLERGTSADPTLSAWMGVP